MTYSSTKFFNLLFFLISLNTFAQSGMYQTVNVEKYQGKKFILEGKIFYKNAFTPESYALLTAFAVSDKSKMIDDPLYNDDVSEPYLQNDWSPYELTGKINKNAKYLGVGIAVMGNGNYYVDAFKLFIKDGKKKVEIPLENAGFEDGSLKYWHTTNMDKNTKISNANDKAFAGTQSLFIDNSGVVEVASLGNNKEVGNYMGVNGVKLYYELYGEGEPLLMLHGNNSAMGRFSDQFDALSEKYQIIGLDSRGQGKSTGNDTKITYELMADDVKTFLDELGLEKVNILGWSDGGNIAVILAMEHPDKVNKMAIMGAVLYNDATSVTAETNKIIRKQVKEMEAKGVAATDMNYRLKMLLLTEPNINPDSLQKIQTPTLVMAGEHDVVKEKHTRLIAEKTPNSEMVIFKGAGHEAPNEIPELFNKTVLDFFSEESN
ncbi:alpha/beta fold hydrolase [Flavimarina sp. Hel_I_48]|uniref:alpha/beta fold hydrolase n=1 Tax=Flavimarina sp. Hel_I_48 TaxID=1392488 RepID=UPI0006921270|nr:alpha/beta hydrolase [Flavimarina sp. Hel_I_48]